MRTQFESRTHTCWVSQMKSPTWEVWAARSDEFHGVEMFSTDHKSKAAAVAEYLSTISPEILDEAIMERRKALKEE